MVDSKQQWKAWLYLSPAIALLLVFTGWPIINTLIMAFSNGYRASYAHIGMTFSFGIDNFKAVLDYKDFWICMKNTVLLCVPTVLISTVLALLIAVALNSIKPLQKLLQTIFFLPYVTNSIAIGLVFAAMFNWIGYRADGAPESYGVINNLIMALGGNPINWINNGSSYWNNMIVMFIYIVWNALPFKILVLLGGLQGINKQYYDAAKVDGTPRWRVLTRVTIPLLSPMLAYVIITGFIGGFKEYSSVVAIFDTSMGPVNDPGRLNTMVGYIYDNIDAANGGFEGRASAAALILFALILVVTVFNNKVIKKHTHY